GDAMKVRTLHVAVIGVAAVLFAESLKVMGFAQIADGLARMGWGFAVILLVSGIRDAVRAFAWTLTVEEPERLRFPSAFRARLAGEALTALIPMGVVVGEPTKASHVGDSVPFGAAFRALAVEFAFYSISLIPLFAIAVAAFAITTRLPIGLTATLVAAASIAV